MVPGVSDWWKLSEYRTCKRLLHEGNKTCIQWSQKNSLICELCSTAGCKKYSSIWVSWDSAGVRGTDKWVRRELAVRNLPLALLQLQQSWQSPGVTEGWLSLCLQDKFTGTENGRCGWSPLCPADPISSTPIRQELSWQHFTCQPHLGEEVQDALAGCGVWKVGDAAEHMPRLALHSWDSTGVGVLV